MNLKPGDVVIALRDLDKEGANVSAGDVGVVFKEETAIHVPGRGDPMHEGPLVRWLVEKCERCSKANRWGSYCYCEVKGELLPAGVCNVYDGDVRLIDEKGN